MYNFTKQTPYKKISFDDILSLSTSLIIGLLFTFVIIFNLNNSNLRDQRTLLMCLTPIVISLFIISAINVFRVLSDYFLPLQNYNGEIAFLRSYMTYGGGSHHSHRRGYYYIYLQGIRIRFLIDSKSYFYLKEGDRAEIAIFPGSKRVKTITIYRDTPIEEMSLDQTFQMESDLVSSEISGDLRNSFTWFIKLLLFIFLGIPIIIILCFFSLLLIRLVLRQINPSATNNYSNSQTNSSISSYNSSSSLSKNTFNNEYKYHTYSSYRSLTSSKASSNDLIN